MTIKLDHALALAGEGFHVFPLEVGSKLPHIDDYPNRASRDPEQINRWWTCPVTGFPQDFNVAISTTRYQDSDALLVVDIDNKGKKHGDKTVLALAAEGFILPDTRTTLTPTGGRHLFYVVPIPAKQGAGVLGDGVDVRSRGGYVVAPGSTVEHGAYTVSSPAGLCAAPQWLVEKCGRDSGNDSRASRTGSPSVDIDAEYLKSLPLTTAGERNHKGFATAAKLKDFGVAEARARELMQDNWLCEPPLDFAELKHVVRSAYRYGREAPGSAAPEVQFAPVHGAEMSTPGGQSEKLDNAHPFEKLNREFAFCIAGGGHHILWETVDENAQPKLEHLSESSFHKRHASQIMQIGTLFADRRCRNSSSGTTDASSPDLSSADPGRLRH